MVSENQKLVFFSELLIGNVKLVICNSFKRRCSLAPQYICILKEETFFINEKFLSDVGHVILVCELNIGLLGVDPGHPSFGHHGGILPRIEAFEAGEIPRGIEYTPWGRGRRWWSYWKWR